MEAALPSRKFYRLIEKDWLLAAAAIIIGLSLGALIAYNSRIGLGISVLPILLIIVLPRPKLGLYMLAASLPFEGIGSLNSDFTAVKLIGVTAFSAWLIKLIRTREINVNPKDRAGLLAILFLAVCALSITQARYPFVGIDRFITMAQLIALYFMVIDLTHDDATFKKVLAVLVLSGVPAALIGISQLILSGADRAAGAYYDPNYSALSLVILIPLSLAFASQNQGNKRRFFWIVFFVLLAGMLVNLSRGGIVALVVMVLMLYRNRFIEPPIKKVIKGLIFAMIIGGILLGMADTRFSLASMLNTRGSGRLDIWRTAWRIFLDHPVLGVGIQNYKFVYLKYAAHMPWIKPSNIVAMVAHNTFVETAVETGIIGFSIFMGLLSVTIFKLRQATFSYWHRLQPELAVECSMLMTSIVGFSVASRFLSAMPKKALWLLLGLAAGRSQKNIGG